MHLSLKQKSCVFLNISNFPEGLAIVFLLGSLLVSVSLQLVDSLNRMPLLLKTVCGYSLSKYSFLYLKFSKEDENLKRNPKEYIRLSLDSQTYCQKSSYIPVPCFDCSTVSVDVRLNVGESFISICFAQGNNCKATQEVICMHTR